MKKILLITLLCFSAITLAQKPIFTSAKIKSATVYSNSAELLQSASVTLPSGTSEIVIKNVTYFTTNEDNGDIYSCVDGDVGEVVGKFKNKKPIFMKRK